MKTTLIALTVTFATLAGCVIETDPYYFEDDYYYEPGPPIVVSPSSPYYEFGSDLTILNRSSYDFYELSIAEAGDPLWSENFLGRNPLLPDEQITIEDLACGVYDVLVVDDEGVACVIGDMPLCDGDRVVTSVTDYDLSGANCD